MKPFSLEEYLKNPSKKIVTKDGRSVRIIRTDRKGEGQPIVALVETPDRDAEYVGTYREDGRWSTSGCASDLDLFFVTEKHEKWVNVYLRSNGDLDFGNTYSSEKEAKDGITSYATYITTVKVEWEE